VDIDANNPKIYDLSGNLSAKQWILISNWATYHISLTRG
jgi:hypothetical protein